MIGVTAVLIVVSLNRNPTIDIIFAVLAVICGTALIIFGILPISSPRARAVMIRTDIRTDTGFDKAKPVLYGMSACGFGLIALGLFKLI